ncbi:MAG: MmcQ/YjbR family DNA-binding protein [Actinomycetota bacterium]|nr:MmcQ/YjbR family DNA-binding protein [Actinomycetota bacterium]
MASLSDVSELALSLPATIEKPSYGTPGFRVKDRLFARMREEPGALAIWCADLDEKECATRAELLRALSAPGRHLLLGAAVRCLPDG